MLIHRTQELTDLIRLCLTAGLLQCEKSESSGVTVYPMTASHTHHLKADGLHETNEVAVPHVCYVTTA